MTDLLIVLTVVLPLVLALGYVWRGGRYHLLGTLPLAALPGLCLALFGSAEPLALPGLLEGALWGIDDLRRVFLTFTSLLWLVSGLFAIFYFVPPARSRHFALFWLLCLSGNLGLILAQDIASFYSFFSLMSLAAYGLVAHNRDRSAARAARVYMAMALAGEMALLAGLIMAAAPERLILLADVPAAVASSAYRNWIILLLFAGFGVKAGVFLLHFWLPLAHPAAPTPASAVLSGSMIKAGLFGWLSTLPLGEVALPGWANAVIMAGLVAAFGAALLGVCQKVPKAVLAYSSVSQMGLMTVMVGVGLATPDAWPTTVAAITLYAMHHCLTKGALFLSEGTAGHAGTWPKWAFWGLVWLLGLSLTGLVLTSGAAAKGALKAALHHAHTGLWLGPALGTLISAGAVATTLLVARFLWCMRLRWGEEDSRKGLVLAWFLAALCALLIFWWLPRPDELSAPSHTLGLFPDLTTGLAKPLSFLWPPALGLAISAVVIALGVRAPAIPPGDLLVPLERLWGRCRRAISAGARVTAALQARLLAVSRAAGGRLIHYTAMVMDGEQQLRARLGLTFVMLLVLLLLGLLLY